MSKNIKLLVKELSIKHNLPESMVDEVLKSQFKFMKDTIENGYKGGYQAIYLGKFIPSNKRVSNYVLKMIAAITNIIEGKKKDVARI